MMGDRPLFETYALATERKTAAGLTAAQVAEIQGDEDEARAMQQRIMVGYDVDVDELLELLQVVGRSSEIAHRLGFPCGQVGGAQFSEGLLVGLLFADRVRREDAAR